MFLRFASLPSVALCLTGCAVVLPVAGSVSEFCPARSDTSQQYFGSPHADDLVIFIHGLCGNAITTWTNASTHFIFPQELARDFANENQPAYVVSFNYVSRLQGGPSILSIADHLEFEIGELLKKHPYRRLRIVAHSMGGLVAREYILRRQARAHPQLRVTNLVLLATPNTGSELAKLGRLIPEHRQIQELRHIDMGNTYLESLNNDWNREFKAAGHPRHILMYAGYEEVPMPVVGKIVKLSSAISYGDQTMGFQEDHISLAKPKDRGVLYRWVKAKLEESLLQTARQLLDGMVQQGLLLKADVPQKLQRTVELLEGLQTLAGTELEKVLTHVKVGQFQEALALLEEGEQNENQVLATIAHRRFTRGEIYELQFKMAQAASHYSQAVQLAPMNAQYRKRYGWLLMETGDVQGAIIQLEEAVRLSRTKREVFLEGAALGNLGIAYDYLGEYAKAIDYHEQALAIHRKIGNVRNESHALGNLGLIYNKLGRYAKAIEYHEEALEIYRKIGAVQWEGRALGNLGVVYAKLGQYAKAIEHHEQALAIHRKIADVRGESAAFRNLGVVYDGLGQYTKAIGHHEQALVIYRKIADVRGEGDTLGSLGASHDHLGQHTKAIEYYGEALSIHRKIGNVRSEGRALGSLGVVYDKLGQYAKAIEYHEQALAILRKIGDVQGESATLGNLGVVYAKLGQHAKAIKYHEQALVIYRKIGDVQGEGAALGNLGVVYDKLGQHAKAIEYLQVSEAIYEKQLRITFPLKTVLKRLITDGRK